MYFSVVVVVFFFYISLRSKKSNAEKNTHRNDMNEEISKKENPKQTNKKKFISIFVYIHIIQLVALYFFRFVVVAVCT